MSHYEYISNIAGFGTLPCCPNQGLATETESLLVAYYGEVSSFLPDILTKAYDKACFGYHDKSCELYNLVNDVHYLFGLLLVLKEERNQDKDSCNSDKGSEYYFEKYKLMCVKKHFKCLGLDIQPLLNVFGLTVTSITQSSEKGINFMYIEESPDPLCTNKYVFKVK